MIGLGLTAVGAGPGPTVTYKIDAPFPWGKDTEVTVPVKAMVDDAFAAAAPHITQLTVDAEDEIKALVPELVNNVMSTVVMPDAQRELDIAFAKLDLAKEDALRMAIGIGVVVVGAVAAAAWWIKRG
jgi:uncharacterized protein YjeT (DUF2065 family)